MDELPSISAAKLKALLHDKVDEFAEELVRSINAAKPGRLIADSEEPVRDAIHDWGRMAFEALVQEKIAAAEAAFPPPADKASGRKKRDKGRQAKHVLTINGRVKLVRRWWYSLSEGSVAPADVWLDSEPSSVSWGVREMACRLNNDGHSFDKTAANLARTAQISLSGEQLRQLTLASGEGVLQAQQSDRIAPAFQAADCLVDPKCPQGPTRIYAGVDGVMVPIITEAEKVLRRKQVCAKRQRRGRKCRPLPPRKKGADQAFKEFKVGVFYDELGEHWHEVLSRGKRRSVGALLRREAKRLKFSQADERIAIVDGASGIRQQLEEQPLPLSGLGLDFYHLSENVHRCRRTVYGEESAEGTAWVEALLHTFQHADYAVVWDQLVEWRRTLKGTRRKQAADRLLNYVSQRRDMINYPEFRGKAGRSAPARRNPAAKPALPV